jgi:hypothetical protein
MEALMVWFVVIWQGNVEVLGKYFCVIYKKLVILQRFL